MKLAPRNPGAFGLGLRRLLCLGWLLLRLGAAGVGGLLQTTTAGAGTDFSAYDGNGNVVGWFDSATGERTATYVYGPFGETLAAYGAAAASNPRRFSTRSEQPETGLVDYGYRFYNPATGRWLSRDPIGEQGGLNLYGFVGGDPIGSVDPLGLRTFGSFQSELRLLQGMGDYERRYRAELYLSAGVINDRAWDTPLSLQLLPPAEAFLVVQSFARQRSDAQAAAELRKDPRYEGFLRILTLINEVGLRPHLRETLQGQYYDGLKSFADLDSDDADYRDLLQRARDVGAVDDATWLSSQGIEWLLTFGGVKCVRAVTRAALGSADDAVRAARGTANANRIMGARAVDDFIVQAERNGFEVVGREVSFRTPFGNRRMDLVLRNLETGKVGGIEIKSTQGAFDRFDKAARQQFAGDRWINTHGADAVGQFEGLSIDHAMKILWPSP